MTTPDMGSEPRRVNGHDKKSSLSPFAEYAHYLLARGYSPLPIKPGTKRPVLNGWAAHCKTPLTDVDIERIARQGNYGIALACGYNNLVAIDVDTSDADVEEVVYGVLPCEVVKRGKKGFTALFRSNGSLKSKKYRGRDGSILFEVLADGNQTVIPPTIHPDTGRPYTWGIDPWAALDAEDACPPPLEHLPELTQAMLAGLVEALTPWLAEAREPAVHASAPALSEGEGVVDQKRLVAWAQTALRGEAEKVAAARKPGRNTQLYNSACALGRYVHHGLLTEGDLRAALAAACHTNGLLQEKGEKAAQDTISSALRKSEHDPLPVLENRPLARGERGGEAEAEERPWVEPQPIEAEVHPVPVFRPEVLLPDALRPWIEDTATRMPCPIEYVAAAAITALGSVIGAKCVIKPKARDDWSIAPNLWGANIGLPSKKKSPAHAEAMRCLDRLAKKAAEAHEAAMHEYAAAQFFREAEKEAIEAEIKSAVKAKKSAEKQVDLNALQNQYSAKLAQSEAAPVQRRYKTNDSSPEKLGELERDNPNGILVVRDELTGLLASLDREGNEGARAFYLEGWNGTGSYDTDRISRGSIHIESHCLSVFGGIQPDKFTQYLEQASGGLGNDGLVQRFQMLVYPNSVPWSYVDRHPDKAARDTAFVVFEALADIDPVSYGAYPADEHNPRAHFRFSEAAQTVFVEWTTELHKRIERTEETENPLIIQHLGKYDKLFASLALIFHCADVAAGVEQPGPVSERAALQAAAWCEFLEPHARRAYGLLLDDGLRSARELSRKIQAGVLPDGFTARDVRRNRWRYLSTSEAVEAALIWLEDAGWVRSCRSQTSPQGGRTTTVYRVNPAIHGGGNGHMG